MGGNPGVYGSSKYADLTANLTTGANALTAMGGSSESDTWTVNAITTFASAVTFSGAATLASTVTISGTPASGIDFTGVPTAQLIKATDDGTITADTGDMTGTASGFMKVLIGAATRYIQLYQV